MGNINGDGIFFGLSEAAIQATTQVFARIGGCSSLQDFAEAAPELLGNPMIIYDTRACVLACTVLDTPDAIYQKLMHGERIPDPVVIHDQRHDYYSTDVEGLSVQRVCYIGRDCLSKVVRIGTRPLGRIVVPLLLREEMPGDTLAMELIANQLVPILTGRKKEPEQPATELGQLFYRMIDGARLSAKEHRFIDGQLRGNMCLLYIDPIGLNDRRLALLRELGGELIDYDGAVAVVLWERGNDYGPEWQAGVIEKLESMWIHCGMSSVIETPDALRRAFLEAKNALAIGMRVNIERMLYPYDDMRLYDLFRSAEDKNDALRRFLSDGMQSLIRIDEEQHLELVKTLHSYLCNNRSLQKTAAELHIHRNTVTHRIARAFELLGVDPEDGRGIMRISTELMLMEYIDRRHYFEPQGGHL